MGERTHPYPLNTETLIQTGIAEKGPSQTGEDAPTIPPADPEHKDDGSTRTGNHARGNFERRGVPRRGLLIGLGALVAAGTLGAGVAIGAQTNGQARGGEVDPTVAPPSPPATETVAPTEAPVERQQLDVEIPAGLPPGEYYLIEPGEPPEVVTDLNRGINTVFNSLDENGHPRVDALGIFFSNEAPDMYQDYYDRMQSFHAFKSYYEDRNPGSNLSYYEEWTVLNLSDGFWGAEADVTVQRRMYVVDQEGYVIDGPAEGEEAEMKEFLLNGAYQKTLPNGETVEVPDIDMSIVR